MSEGTVCEGGSVGCIVASELVFGSGRSGREEEGGESQCTDENSESAIAGRCESGTLFESTTGGGTANDAGDRATDSCSAVLIMAW
jgi:hypothetical protein